MCVLGSGEFLLFHPISLCNVLYKIITKIIVTHFKPVFPKLIAQNQVSFVVGRHIMDNIIISQEIVHSSDNQEGEEGMDGHQDRSGEGL
ncbi:reverse transcriptase [Gossypium australe]|uniref:Reverse transcriptase n=1 Tax=Gossypium australe TaxID=47621 RepID=A0A5B6WCU0_9ROSI|nr:reverse transcriptase [Gossypium australe]